MCLYAVHAALEPYTNIYTYSTDWLSFVWHRIRLYSRTLRTREWSGKLYVRDDRGAARGDVVDSHSHVHGQTVLLRIG